MARQAKTQTATKDELNTSTSLAPIGHNQPPMVDDESERLEKLVDQYADQAIADDKDGEKLKGSGVQRMAAAVFLHALAGGTLKTFDHYLTSGDTKKDIHSEMFLRLLGAKTEAPKDKNADDYNDMDARAKGERLVKAGCRLVACLVKNGATEDMFVPEHGWWLVKPPDLVKHPYECLDVEELTPLDGLMIQTRIPRQHAVRGKPQYGKVQASAAQYMTIADPPKEGTRAAAQSGTTARGNTSKNFADGNKSFRDACALIKSRIDAVMDVSKDAPPNYKPNRDAMEREDLDRLTVLARNIMRMFEAFDRTDAEAKGAPTIEGKIAA